MLVHQLLHSGPNLPLALKLWISIFTSLKNWNRTREVLYLLDQIVKFSFYANELETVMSVLQEANEEYRQGKPARGGGGMSSLVSWMTVGSAPSYVLIDGARLAEYANKFSFLRNSSYFLLSSYFLHRRIHWLYVFGTWQIIWTDGFPTSGAQC